MDSNEVPNPVTQGFTSYTRADNEAFRGVVDQLRNDLTAMYSAKTGKDLHLFLDRESIGWGEDWRQRIHQSVEGASIFIPIVTMRYFTSQMCCEELMTFHAAADRLGVTDLILPIVLFGAEQIRDEDPRAEVQLISKLNYKNVEFAWTAGYDSPEWRRFVADCVNALDAAIQNAETVLSQTERTAATVGPEHEVSQDGADADEFMGIDLVMLTERMEQVEPLSAAALQDLEEIGEMISSFNLEGVAASTGRVRLMNLADSLKEPAYRIQENGQELEKLMFGLDSEIRSFAAELSTIDLPEARQQLRDLLESFQTDENLSDVEDSIQQAIQMVRLISVTNVSIKKALRPAVSGFRSIQKSVGVFKGWQQLAASLES